MKPLRLVVINIVVFLLLAELVSMGWLSFQHGCFFAWNAPPLSLDYSWIADAEKKAIVKDFDSRHPVLHPLFSNFAVPAPRKPPEEYDTALWAKYIQAGNLYDGGDNCAYVGVFGGSYAYNIALSLGSALERAGAFKGKKIVVLLYAGGGAKQPIALAQAAYFLSKGQRLDAAVTIDGYNEVKGGITNLEKNVSVSMPTCDSQYVVDWLLRNSDGSEESQIEHATLVLDAARLKRVESLADNAKLASMRLILELYARRLQSDLVARRKSLLESMRLQGELEFFFLAAGKKSADLRKDVDKIVEYWAQCANLMDTLFQSRGVKYYHFLQPNQYYLYSQKKDDPALAKFLANISNRELIPLAYAAYKKKIAEISKPNITFDLVDTFERAEKNYYYDDCCHMDKEGNDLVAAEIAKIIAQGAP